MTNEEAIAAFEKYLEIAKQSDYIRNKVAWALYQTWKEADKG